MIRLTDVESGKKCYFKPEAIVAVEEKLGSTRIKVDLSFFQVREKPVMISNLIIRSRNAEHSYS